MKEEIDYMRNAKIVIAPNAIPIEQWLRTKFIQLAKEMYGADIDIEFKRKKSKSDAS